MGTGNVVGMGSLASWQDWVHEEVVRFKDFGTIRPYFHLFLTIRST